jgi:hypothetical protein
MAAQEYYMLIDRSNGRYWYRIEADLFEELFEPHEKHTPHETKYPSRTRTYRFKKPPDGKMNGLDSFMCAREFMHERSEWPCADEAFHVKGVYFWHNNIYE